MADSRFPVLPVVALHLTLILIIAPALAGAQTRNDDAEKARAFAALKCERYQKAEAEARVRLGAAGLGEAFLVAHQRFIAAGCQARADVCPVSPEEFRFANMMVVLGMNHGLSSTFFPFACRKTP